VNRLLIVAVASALFVSMPSAKSADCISFIPVSDLKQDGTGTALINARIARTSDYPASMFSVIGNKYCGATLVASKALLTAAHCVPAGVAVNLPNDVQATCTPASDFFNDAPDLALCLLSKEIVAPYEVIDTQGKGMGKDAEVLLTGFGCTKSNFSGRDGKFREGEAYVVSPPESAATYVRVNRGAALCRGDSGSAAFATGDTANSPRYLIAANSQVELTSAGKASDTSRLANLSSSSANTFLKVWSEQNKIDLCGLSGKATGCRH